MKHLITRRSLLIKLLVESFLIAIITFPLSPQQSDPFYVGLLEKAQKSFLAKKYEEAARSFEIAAFGLLDNKSMRAKALVYLGLCRYYLKDLGAAENSLREAASLMGEEGFKNLAIYETAWPELEKLLVFFNLSPPQNINVPKEVEKISPDFVIKPSNETPGDPLAKPEKIPEENPSKSSPENKRQESATKQSQADPDSARTNLRLNEIKEGDLVPLELLDSPPKVIKRVAAVPPILAGASENEGTVILNVLVSEKGAVIKTEIIKGMKQVFGFDQAAQRAVKQWKFEPGSVKGIKVKVWIPVAIEFKKSAVS